MGALRVFALLAGTVALAAAKKSVLLTGFEPFDQESSNPSGDVARLLNGTCTDTLCFESLILSVDSDGARVVASLLAASNSSRWDAILQLGEDVPAQFQTVKYAHLELVAANVASHGNSAKDVASDRTTA